MSKCENINESWGIYSAFLNRFGTINSALRNIKITNDKTNTVLITNVIINVYMYVISESKEYDIEVDTINLHLVNTEYRYIPEPRYTIPEVLQELITPLDCKRYTPIDEFITLYLRDKNIPLHILKTLTELFDSNLIQLTKKELNSL